MGQKINPISVRLGFIKGWDSNWYGGKDFSFNLKEDYEIRKYILARLPKAGIAKIFIERSLKSIDITIHTARPVNDKLNLIIYYENTINKPSVANSFPRYSSSFGVKLRLSLSQ